MASKMLRRSGVACGLVCDALDWRADTIIQCGVGLYHEEMAVLKEEWAGVRIYGVDPQPNVPEAVKKSGLFDLFLNVAASDKYGEAVLWSKRHHSDGSSLSKVADSCRKIQVQCDTLDNMFLSDPCIDYGRLLLWLDCEGHELAVLRGAKRLIERVHVINVEMTGKPPSPEWSSPADVHRKLVECGFFAQWQHTGRVTLGQADWIYVRRELFQPEICCFPWEVERWRKENE